MKLLKKVCCIAFNVLLTILFNKLLNLLPENYKQNMEYILPLIGIALLLFDLYFVVFKQNYTTVVYIIISDLCFLIAAGFLAYYILTNDKSSEITFILKRNKEILALFVIFMMILLVRAYLKSAKFKISKNSTDVER